MSYHAAAYRILEVPSRNGGSAFGAWFDRLEATTAARVRAAIARLEQGNLSRVQWFRGIGEQRIDTGPGLRIYLARDGGSVILLLGGGTKRRQRRDIDAAIVLHEDYLRRKASSLPGTRPWP